MLGSICHWALSLVYFVAILFTNRILLNCPNWPWIHSVAQISPEFVILLQQATEYLVISAYITSTSYPIISFKLSFLWLACLHPNTPFGTPWCGICPRYSTENFKWNHLLTATLIFHLFLPAYNPQNSDIVWWSPPIHIHHAVILEDLRFELMI